MKRLLLVATSVLCLAVFFFACSDLQNLSEPKKVVVKPGDAKYSIPFGGYSVAFNDYLNVTKLQENLTDASGDDVKLFVWDYQDSIEKNVQKYIIEYPITSISLNPDDYLGDITDFLQDFKLSDGGSQISIPINDVFEQVSKSLADCSTEVPFSLQTLNDTIKDLPKDDNQVTGVTLSVTEEIPSKQIGFDYGGNGFIKQAIIKSGTFTIDCELPHGWSGVTAKVELSVSGAIEGAQFKDAGKTDAVLISQKADLSGKTINGKEKDLNITGAVTLEFYNATIVLDDDGTVPDLTLVCTSQIEKIRDAQIYLEKVINEGDLAYKDSIPVHIPEYVKNCKIVRLDMQTAIDTNLDGLIKSLYMAPKISSKYMGFDDSGSYNNIFDNANGLRITKDVDEGWEGFYLVENGESQEEIDIAVDFDIRGDNYDPNSPKDYNKEEDTITITEFDLTKASDTEYYLKPTFAAPEGSTMFECDELELQIDSSPFKGSMETGLNIGDLLDDLVDSGDNSALGDLVNELKNKIELQGIEGYLYITAPKTKGEEAIDFADLLSPITGYVKASYEGSDPKVLIGKESGDNKVELSIKNNVPSFASLADEDRLIADDSIFSEKYYSAKTEKDSLTGIINKKANDLTFDYDISFGGSEGNTITLTRAQIRTLQDAANAAAGGSVTASAEIAMTIAVVLPLKLNLTDDIVVDNIMALAGDGEDVDFLGDEDSDSDFSEYTDYTEALKLLELWYQFKNPLNGLSISAEFSEKNISKKKMHFDNEKHFISLTPEEIDNILTESSFIPQISMTLKEGIVSVTRNAELKMNAALVIKTDNDADIEFEL